MTQFNPHRPDISKDQELNYFRLETNHRINNLRQDKYNRILNREISDKVVIEDNKKKKRKINQNLKIKLEIFEMNNFFYITPIQDYISNIIQEHFIWIWKYYTIIKRRVTSAMNNS